MICRVCTTLEDSFWDRALKLTIYNKQACWSNFVNQTAKLALISALAEECCPLPKVCNEGMCAPKNCIE